MQGVQTICTPGTKICISKSVRYADDGFTPLQKTTVNGRMRACGVWMKTPRVSLSTVETGHVYTEYFHRSKFCLLGAHPGAN